MKRLSTFFADAMAHADGCECGNTQPPDAAVPSRTAWLIHYRCDDCGRAWTQVWDGVAA